MTWEKADHSPFTRSELDRVVESLNGAGYPTWYVGSIGSVNNLIRIGGIEIHQRVGTGDYVILRLSDDAVTLSIGPTRGEIPPLDAPLAHAGLVRTP